MGAVGLFGVACIEGRNWLAGLASRDFLRSFHMHVFVWFAGILADGRSVIDGFIGIVLAV